MKPFKNRLQSKSSFFKVKALDQFRASFGMRWNSKWTSLGLLGLALSCHLGWQKVLAEEAASAKWSAVIIPYHTQSDHSHAANSDSETNGLYAFLGRGNHGLELEHDAFESKSNVEEEHNIAIYNYYGLKNWNFKLGYHQVDQKLQEGDMYIAGLKYIRYNKYNYRTWEWGVDLFSTEYAANFDVLQISPEVKKYHVFKRLGGYSEVVLALDHVDFSRKLYNDDRFLMGRLDFTQHWDKFSWNLGLWLGESSYWVRSAGFLLFNSPDVLEQGVGTSLTWRLNKKVALKGLYQVYGAESSSDGRSADFQRFGAYLQFSF
jgi:hypothetical protein